jgi:hypothetical protein
MNQIERKYQSKAARPGDPPRLNAATAIQFIDECSTRGIEVLGFDAFRMLLDGRLQPLLEDTLDFDWQHRNELTYSEKLQLAKSIVERRVGTDIVFEIVLKDEPH